MRPVRFGCGGPSHSSCPKKRTWLWRKKLKPAQLFHRRRLCDTALTNPVKGPTSSDRLSPMDWGKNRGHNLTSLSGSRYVNWMTPDRSPDLASLGEKVESVSTFFPAVSCVYSGNHWGSDHSAKTNRPHSNEWETLHFCWITWFGVNTAKESGWQWKRKPDVQVLTKDIMPYQSEL